MLALVLIGCLSRPDEQKEPTHAEIDAGFFALHDCMFDAWEGGNVAHDCGAIRTHLHERMNEEWVRLHVESSWTFAHLPIEHERFEFDDEAFHIVYVFGKVRGTNVERVYNAVAPVVRENPDLIHCFSVDVTTHPACTWFDPALLLSFYGGEPAPFDVARTIVRQGKLHTWGSAAFIAHKPSAVDDLSGARRPIGSWRNPIVKRYNRQVAYGVEGVPRKDPSTAPPFRINPYW